MPHRDRAPAGAPCWIDLFTSDPDRTLAFYAELFGWKATDAGEEFGHYVNFTKDDVLVAGAMRNDGAAGTPDLWSVYLAVDDAAATVGAATEHGANVIVPATAVGDLGVMAVITDPGGDGIGMWQPQLHKGFGIFAEHGTPAWFELHTRAYDAALAFYRDVFHWTTTLHSDTPEFRYTQFGDGETQYGGVMDATAFPPDHPTGWSVYFAVDDADAALARIAGLGGRALRPAEDTPYGRLAEAADPTGARFKLVSGMQPA